MKTIKNVLVTNSIIHYGKNHENSNDVLIPDIEKTGKKLSLNQSTASDSEVLFPFNLNTKK